MKKIAFIGIRGIPVVYSGFESFVEDLTSNIGGFYFSVYCRKRYVQKKYFNNINLIYTPTIYIYKLETFIHSFLSTLHAILFLKPQILFYLSVGNAPFLILPKLFGIKAIINVDGMDWDREKWGRFGRLYLSLCAYLSVKLADAVITDSLYSQEYYKKRFKHDTTYIPYMANGYKWKENQNTLKKNDLLKESYYVWAGRFVPDNHLDDLIDAYSSAPELKRHLVIIGDDNYETNYVKRLKKVVSVDKRITLTGFIPCDEYLTLIKNSYAYIETKQSGGTHPSLLEGLTYAPRVICNDFDANRKVCENNAFFYKNRSIPALKGTLSKKIPKSEYVSNSCYDVEYIIQKYRQLFAKI
jgi:glycosyltransferase involved in cell wall biosynthesis